MTVTFGLRQLLSLRRDRALGRFTVRDFQSSSLCFTFGSAFRCNSSPGLHVVIGSSTATLIYLVGEIAFNRWIAVPAACFFCFDPSQITQTPQASTEPMGLIFFVGTVYCLMLAASVRD